MKKLLIGAISAMSLFSASLMAQETEAFKASIPEKKQNTEQQKQLDRQLNRQENFSGSETGGVSATGLGSLSVSTVTLGAVALSGAVLLISEDSDSSTGNTTTSVTSTN